MKQLQLFGLALIAALGLSILAGAGATQATIFCTTEETACSMAYPLGTAIDLRLKSGASMALRSTGGGLEATCTGGTINGRSGAETGGTVSIGLSEWSWSSCGQTADTLAVGSLEIEHIEGTHNGTVVGKGTEWRFTIGGVNCNFGFGAGTDLGTLTGGAEPVLKVSAIVSKTGGSILCPADSRLEAEFVVIEPHALYVI